MAILESHPWSDCAAWDLVPMGTPDCCYRDFPVLFDLTLDSVSPVRRCMWVMMIY